jgi:hypothetical protein
VADKGAELRWIAHAIGVQKNATERFQCLSDRLLKMGVSKTPRDNRYALDCLVSEVTRDRQRESNHSRLACRIGSLTALAFEGRD